MWEIYSYLSSSLLLIFVIIIRYALKKLIAILHLSILGRFKHQYQNIHKQFDNIWSTFHQRIQQLNKIIMNWKNIKIFAMNSSSSSIQQQQSNNQYIFMKNTITSYQQSIMNLIQQIHSQSNCKITNIKQIKRQCVLDTIYQQYRLTRLQILSNITENQSYRHRLTSIKQLYGYKNMVVNNLRQINGRMKECMRFMDQCSIYQFMKKLMVNNCHSVQDNTEYDNSYDNNQQLTSINNIRYILKLISDENIPQSANQLPSTTRLQSILTQHKLLFNKIAQQIEILSNKKHIIQQSSTKIQINMPQTNKSVHINQNQYIHPNLQTTLGSINRNISSPSYIFTHGDNNNKQQQQQINNRKQDNQLSMGNSNQHYFRFVHQLDNLIYSGYVSHREEMGELEQMEELEEIGNEKGEIIGEQSKYQVYEM